MAGATLLAVAPWGGRRAAGDKPKADQSADTTHGTPQHCGLFADAMPCSGSGARALGPLLSFLPSFHLTKNRASTGA